jgi:hypothetical protein
MKKLGFMVAALLVAAVGSSFAQTNDYLVKVKGTFTDNTGKTKVIDSDLVSTNGSVLVLRIIKNTPRSVRLEERDSTGTNLVSSLLTSFREAFLTSGQFGGDLEDDSADFNGDIQIQGKETPSTSPTKVKASLVGVGNDTIANSSLPDSLFKGTLSGSKLP